MKNLRKIREVRGLTREQLAVMAGVSFGVITSHENGHVKGVYEENAQKLASALGVHVASLFFDGYIEKRVNQEDTDIDEALTDSLTTPLAMTSLPPKEQGADHPTDPPTPSEKVAT